MLYRYLLRPYLFSKDPESAHTLALRTVEYIGKRPALGKILRALTSSEDTRLASTQWNIPFSNPIGLAAGFDKNGTALQGLSGLGFGFLEMGTVTGIAQVGNPKPRVFRDTAHNAIINQLGFPSDGVEIVAKRLAANSKLPVPLGINIGKSALLDVREAAKDYVYCFERLSPHADYFTINVSSPNTLGLRELQEKELLSSLLRKLSQKKESLGKKTPILLKISPDLNSGELDDIISVVRRQSIDGIVATNTTTNPRVMSLTNHQEGGISGEPLRELSQKTIAYLYSHSKGKIPIVGVGGIMNADHAWEMISAGACLLQLYTGLVYNGPMTVKQIKRGISKRLREEGFGSISEAVGRKNKL